MKIIDLQRIGILSNDSLAANKREIVTWINGHPAACRKNAFASWSVVS